MGQARSVEVVFTGEENLGLRLQLPEGLGVDDPVAVDLKRVAVVRLARTPVGLAVEVAVELVPHQRGQVGIWAFAVANPLRRRFPIPFPPMAARIPPSLLRR